MHETNLLAAFASYKVKLPRRGRSAMTPDGSLVVSCWYAGFKKARVEILRYEEDLSGQAGGVASALRAHLAEAKTNEYDVRVIVGVAALDPKAVDQGIPTRATYYARKDLVGRVTFFDGDRVVIEFRRNPIPAQGKLAKGASVTQRRA
jgi:hypothetical protein